MLAFELRKNASDVDAKITATKEALEQLTRRRDSIQPTTSLTEIEQLIQDIKNHEAKLEKLQLLRMAIQKKLNEYANNASKAKPLVEDGSAAHKRGREIFVKLAKHQAEVRDLVKELDQEVNVTMSTKVKEFEDLTGESMGLTLSMVCYPAMAFAAAETIKPYDAWAYRSETELKAEHERLKAEQLKRHEERIKIAEAHAPDCPNCARANRETKMTIARAEGRSDTPGESMYHGMWHFACPKCGNILQQAIPETK